MAISKFQKYSRLMKSLGPGILFACVTVGGTHFVQATHAGTEYGFIVLLLVLLIYLLKYPFFEYAQRFAAATHQTLLQGYLKIGRWALLLYFILVACTSFPTLAALSLMDANITAYFLNTTISPMVLGIGLLALCTLILLFGNFPLLDKMVKIIVAVLIVSSIATVTMALLNRGPRPLQTPPAHFTTLTGFTFLIALMGWMPAPIDVSVWTTLWSRARAMQTKYQPTLKETLFDFNLGYAISLLLAIIFVVLGAIVMYETGQSFSRSGVLFIEELITLFTTHIGKWSELFIAITIFGVMYSTTLACLDAYPRALTNALALVFPKLRHLTELIYWVWVLLLFFISIILLGYFSKRMKQLIDIATILAFLTAPIFGYLNYRVVTHNKAIPQEAAPPKFLLILSKVGLIFLLFISLLFIFLLFV